MQKKNRSFTIKLLDRDVEGNLLSADVGGSDLVSRCNGKGPKAKKVAEFSDMFMKRKIDKQIAFDKLDKATKKIRMEKAAAFPEQDVTKETVLREPSVGKGSSGALNWLRERGALSQTVEPMIMSGRKMDKKIADGGRAKEICIERKDKYGRDLTPKQAFRELCYKFHGKEPGRQKQEKMMKLYQDELRVKQGSSFDAAVERLRKTQSQLKTPYVVLDGYVKP